MSETRTRKIQIFSAGCPICEASVALVRETACPSCEISVHDMHDEAGPARARQLGVVSLPAVAVDGKLASCCEGRQMTVAALREAGIGVPR
ncbi:MAG: thioredoxin family protein [Armatimonadetes bacterium]|nr:thioredoxin family protein [Armatimonadota bacterium]